MFNFFFKWLDTPQGADTRDGFGADSGFNAVISP